MPTPEEDFRRRVVDETWRYFREKIRIAPADELRQILDAFEYELWKKLVKRPVIRIWPDQWLKFPPS